MEACKETMQGMALQGAWTRQLNNSERQYRKTQCIYTARNMTAKETKP